MRTHPLFAASSHDPLLEWAGRLRGEVLTEMAPSSIGGIAGLAAAGAVSAALTAAVATAATVAVIEGGTTMTSTAIAATAASHVALKLAAGGLAAALTVGGAAAVTGNLPDGAQSFAADAAAHIGLDLPRPDATIGGSLDLSVGDIVTVGGAGRVGVTLDGDGLQLNGIEANAGFTARVVSSTADTLIVEFQSAMETTTVLVTNLEGEVMSSITTTLHGSADAAAEADANANTSADAKANAEADTSAKGEAEAEAEAGFGVTVGG